MTASLSADRAYRYRLDRDLGAIGDGTALFVMLNPSRADEYEDDLTITKCRKFAASWGAQSLVVVNLFAFRATDPDDLFAALAPVEHPTELGRNDATIECAALAARIRVAAWGATRAGEPAVAARTRRVVELLHATPLLGAGVPTLQCLGTTGAGHPFHPSRRPYASTLRPWAPRMPAGNP